MNGKHRLLQVIVSALALLLVLAVAGTSTVAREAAGILDDKVFVGSTGKKGKEASEQDEIRFENGHLRSLSCEEWGFEKAPYTVQAEGDTIRFHAVALSPRHGTIEWDGLVQDNTVEATYVWTKKRWYWKDAHQEKWFKGTMN